MERKTQKESGSHNFIVVEIDPIIKWQGVVCGERFLVQIARIDAGVVRVLSCKKRDR